ncbi:ATP-binding protein [Nostoc sp. FACHB-110]|uniref:ATP-binding protein n=1 Tax=Nostoc sp. FACHB-110 TaxID=2692834 RepID=UPI001682D8AE|nr:ATP-binding protein [Nostoc sp. FACHB-110]MBD2437094.1 ATP-binding protein [Nostoc sp. FACHB-110]
MKFISLFPTEHSTEIDKFVRKQLEYYLKDNQYTHILFAPSVKDTEILMRGGTQLSLISRKSPFSHLRSDLREISVSGHISKEQGNEILKALLSEPLKNERVGSTLHIHLANYHPIEGEDNNPISSTEEKSELNLFEIIEPQATMDDLILPEDLKKRILRNLIIIKHQHILFDQWGLKDIAGFKNKLAVSLNLVGLPGTGKTFAAEAIAKKLNKSLMVVNYAGLESKYVGDTSKHIKIVFEEASKNDAVLFFDEADSFLGRRVEDVQQSYDTAVNNTRSVMLIELAKFNGVILFATNLVSNYDPAFRRRILDHIEFPLPDEKGRAIILEKHTPTNLPGHQQLDFQLLAAKSEGFSGSDLANVVYKSCITLLEKFDRGLQEIISTEEYLKAIDEVKQSRRLIRDSIRLKEVTADEIYEEMSKEEQVSTN